VIAHIGAVPLEELLLPASGGLLVVRGWIMLHLRRR
jgi:hypothetical protein